MARATEATPPDCQHEMVCVLLALYVVDVAPETEAYGDVGGAFIPQDAA